MDSTDATCRTCGKTPGFQCREHFVRSIKTLQEALTELVSNPSVAAVIEVLDPVALAEARKALNL